MRTEVVPTVIVLTREYSIVYNFIAQATVYACIVPIHFQSTVLVVSVTYSVLNYRGTEVQYIE